MLIPTEEVEQRMVVEYLELKGLRFTAIPNSTYTTSWKQKMKNKDMGLRAGIPDLLVIVNKSLIFIEMKRIKNSSTSHEQKLWNERLNKCRGVCAYLCFGFSQAKEVIDKHLKT